MRMLGPLFSRIEATTQENFGGLLFTTVSSQISRNDPIQKKGETPTGLICIGTIKKKQNTDSLLNGQTPGSKVFGGFAADLTIIQLPLKRFCTWQSSLFVSDG